MAVPSSAQFCTACGAGLVRPYVAGGSEAPCVRHPGNLAVAACARCGGFSCPLCLAAGEQDEALCSDCQALVPHELLPWDRRAEAGTFRAFWRTSVGIIKAPDKLFARARPTGSAGDSLLFVLLAHAVGMATTGLVYGVFIGVVGLATGKPDQGLPALGIGALMLLLFWVGIPVMAVAGAVVTAGLDHLVLRLVGARPRSFEVTLRATALSYGPYLFGLVPLCALYVVPFWSYGLKVIAYRHFHRTTPGRAALGALLVPGLAMAAVVVVYVLILAVALGTAGR